MSTMATVPAPRMRAACSARIADQARADHDDQVAGLDSADARRVHGDRGGLHHRPRIERDGVGQRVQQARRNDHVLGHRPVAAEGRGRHAEGLARLAQVGLAAPARRAAPAPDDRVERDACPGRPAVHSGADRLDDARRLVTHDDGWQAPARRPRVAVRVRAADRHRHDAHQDVPGTRDGRGALLELQLQRAGVDEGLHRGITAAGRRGSSAHAPLGAAMAGEDVRDVVQGDGRGDQRERVDGPRGEQVDRPFEAARCAQDPDRRDVLQRHRARVDQARLAGEADVDHPAPGLDEVERQRRHVRRVGGIDDRVPAQVGSVSRVQSCSKPSVRAKVRDRSLRPSEVDLDALGGRDAARPGARSSRPRARATARRPPGRLRGRHGARCRRARPSRPADGPTDSGSGTQRPHGHRQLLRQRARPAEPDADLVAVRAEVLAPARAARARPAAEHRVAGHPTADPRRIDAVPDRRHGAGPLVADPDRIRRLVRVQVGHLARVELDVRAADTGPVDVDDHLAGPGLRPRQLAHLRDAGTGDHERPHRHRHAVSRMTTMMP